MSTLPNHPDINGIGLQGYSPEELQSFIDQRELVKKNLLASGHKCNCNTEQKNLVMRKYIRRIKHDTKNNGT